MKYIILFLSLFSLYLFQSENSDNIQKALLIKTNLTKEELTNLLLENSENNNTSIEEVEPETETDKESIVKSLKDGKLKIKIKFELDLNNILKKENKTETEPEGENENTQESSVRTAFIQTVNLEMRQKISLSKYILAGLISLILMSLFALSSHNKKYKKQFLNKYRKRQGGYLLEDN